MPKSLNRTTPTEWLLARLTTPTRATAILGDLLEISATRGRLWFWFAYTRTLIFLGWRIPVALLCAYFFYEWLGIRLAWIVNSPLIHFYINLPHNAAARIPGWLVNPLFNFFDSLWFILPFALVRFGLRDRLTQLASAIFVLTIPFFILMPAEMDFSGLATAVIVIASLSLRTWRRPMIVLAASIAPVAVATLFSPMLLHIFLSRWQGQCVIFLFRVVPVLPNRALNLCIAALVCSLLHRHLLQPKPADLHHSGATHA
jgi:hypothetical protein